MKKVITFAAASIIAAGANAATLTLNNLYLTNSFVTDAEGPAAGVLTGDASSLTGTVDFLGCGLGDMNADNDATQPCADLGIGGFDYNAQWTLNLNTGSLNVANVDCVDEGLGNACDGLPTGSLTLGVANNELTWGGSTSYRLTYTFEDTPAEVPVPAAAWLFGSALVGLGGVARRKKA